MIEIKNIVKTYHPKKGGAVIALNNVSLNSPKKASCLFWVNQAAANLLF